MTNVLISPEKPININMVSDKVKSNLKKPIATL